MTATMITPTGALDATPPQENPAPREPGRAGREPLDEAVLARHRSVRMGLACGAATLLASAALLPVFVNQGWLAATAATLLAVTLTGIGVRALPRGAAMAPVFQLLAVFVVLNLFFADHLRLGVIPTPASTRDLWAVLGDGLLDLQSQAAPALLLEGLVALTALAIGLMAILVEILAIRLGRAALSGLVLLVIYLVPVATLVGSLNVVSFAGPALGYLLLLFADGRDGVTRWGRSVTPGGHRSLPGLVTAAKVGVGAVGLGLLLPLIIPTWPEGLLGQQFGGGSGTGPGTALSPTARLLGELTLPEPKDLLQVDTNVDDPFYLRAVALNNYGTDGWSLGNLDSQVQVEGNGLLTRLPGPQVLRTINADITALQHNDRFLPVFGSPVSVEAPGDWRFDENSGTIFSRDDTTEGLTYSLHSQQPTPSRSQLGRAPDLDPDNPLQIEFTQLPTGLDPSIAALVDSLVTNANAGSPYERGLAINNYLTDSANGFLYSLTTEPGSSGDDLVNFLRNKRGFCEQYAAAMGVLLRAAGIPARVVLGYTPGTFDDGTWTVTTDDAHAWVEAYFSGLGWIPFDPTPIGPGRAVELGYAPRADSVPDAAPTASAPSTSPGQVPAGPGGELDESLSDPNTLTRTGTQDGLNWVQIASGTGAVLVLLLVLAPSLIRISTRRRRTRLAARNRAGPGAHAAWDELLDTATDLGLTSQPDETPRTLARRLAREAMFDAESAVAVRDIALAEERARYAPESVTLSRSVDLAPPLRSARRALRRHAGRRQRFRARVMPASTVNRLRPSTRSARRKTRPPGRSP
ncbi:MAG: DUF3488 and transglutaminase-like domain-containing protein, partial [Actinomycetota bacterium]|nr:DUF3488 and transglutaminase-like domain-containing protein [Actinomycetota bacterium]